MLNLMVLAFIGNKGALIKGEQYSKQRGCTQEGNQVLSSQAEQIARSANQDSTGRCKLVESN